MSDLTQTAVVYGEVSIRMNALVDKQSRRIVELLEEKLARQAEIKAMEDKQHRRTLELLDENLALLAEIKVKEEQGAEREAALWQAQGVHLTLKKEIKALLLEQQAKEQEAKRPNECSSGSESRPAKRPFELQ